MKKCIIKLSALLLVCCAMLGCTPDEQLGSIYGIVTDYTTGEPVGNANVKLRPNGETTLTGSDGAYEFNDLKAGKYSLLLSKAEYADLDDDYVIELEAGKDVKRDVQLRKKVASLKIVDMSGNPLDTLDFGDQESVRVKTFNVFNDGTETLTCTVTYDCDWITNISGLGSQIQSGQTVPVTVRIDRVALEDGDNTTFLYITSANGSNELVVKASFLGQPAINTKNPTDVTSNSATLAGKIADDGGRPVLVRGICYGTSQSPDISGSHTEDGSGTGDYSHNVTGLSSATTYYARAYATNRNGTYYASNIVSFTTTSGLPTVTTNSVTNITTTTAKCGGNVTNNGGYNVTVRGICWNTIGGPDLNDQHTTNGSGNGAFTANLTGLEKNVTYYVRAYATNQIGTSYGEEVSFTTNDGSITVTTNSISNITSTSAICGGVVTVSLGDPYPVTARGVCWSTGHNPSVSNSHTTDGTGSGAFTSTISGLSINTLYYVRAYATNQLGTYYGQEKSFTTAVGLPVVTTTDPMLNGTTVTTGGNVTSDGGYTVTARGICYGSLPNPDLSSTYSHTTDGSGTGYFSSTFSLPGGSGKYYIRAYATNANGTIYGAQKSIIQPYDELPTFQFNGNTYRVAPNANNTLMWADANAYCNNLTLHGYSDWKLPTKEELLQMYNDRISIGGFVDGRYWSSTSSGSNTHYLVSFRNGSVSEDTDSYYYYVRPIRQETGGGTTPVAPTVTTSSPYGVTSSSATCGGNVISDGGATVTQRGVCYSTSQNPTTSSQTVTSGSGTGSFTCNLTGLTANTTYYVRAYAVNSAGTAYGAQQSFTTTGGGGGGATTPTVTTTTPYNISANSAVCGGNVTSDGGATVTQRGVCYSTSQNPTTSSMVVTSGSGTGSFTCNLTGLSENTTYYVRAFAINNEGTSYGGQVSFTTISVTISDWLQYDDGNGIDAIGLDEGGTISWANMYPSSMLGQYAGTSIVEIGVLLDLAGTYSLKIYSGGTSSPGSMVASFDVNHSYSDFGWYYITLPNAVLLDTSQNLWIVFSKPHFVGEYPAGVCADSGDPNGRWLSENGGTWGDLAAQSLLYTWGIHTFVTNQTKAGKHGRTQIISSQIKGKKIANP